MKHIQIKGLDKPVSKLVMGSDFFRLDNGQEVSEILHHYLAIGGNTIDSAHIYCGGQSEQALGFGWMKRGKEKKWCLSPRALIMIKMVLA